MSDRKNLDHFSLVRNFELTGESEAGNKILNLESYEISSRPPAATSASFGSNFLSKTLSNQISNLGYEGIRVHDLNLSRLPKVFGPSQG